MPRQVLFLCTGNYYRSRFAEEVFNHLAQQAGLEWTATSRGLGLSAPSESRNVGPISKHAVQALSVCGIPCVGAERNPQQVMEEDLRQADRVICLKEAEHRPMVRLLFPDWIDRVEFWHIHDLDIAPAEAALPDIERQVRSLVDLLAAGT
jgi:protein-tyrosine-phosphatase